MLTAPINLPKWLDENSHLLQPPVNNYCINRGGFTVMTPEWFHQVKGSMTLKVVDDGEFKDITIDEGDIFLLPPNVPHNPVRYADTVGIVVEQDRPKDVKDSLRWYCKGCKSIVHEDSFHMYDLGTQIKEAIAKFDADIELRTCKNCGEVATSR